MKLQQEPVVYAGLRRRIWGALRGDATKENSNAWQGDLSCFADARAGLGHRGIRTDQQIRSHRRRSYVLLWPGDFGPVTAGRRTAIFGKECVEQCADPTAADRTRLQSDANDAASLTIRQYRRSHVFVRPGLPVAQR